jgi:hypothetical protein
MLPAPQKLKLRAITARCWVPVVMSPEEMRMNTALNSAQSGCRHSRPKP